MLGRDSRDPSGVPGIPLAPIGAAGDLPHAGGMDTPTDPLILAVRETVRDLRESCKSSRRLRDLSRQNRHIVRLRVAISARERELRWEAGLGDEIRTIC